MQRYEQVSEFKERLVAVNRVSKTVKLNPWRTISQTVITKE